MKTKLLGLGTLSLFLIMLIPAYAEITEFGIEKSFYTNEEGIAFVGTTSESDSMINVVMENPNGKESYFIGARSNSDDVVKTTPKNVSDYFSIIGTYQFTAFTIQKDDGIGLSLEFDGNRVLEEIFSILELNSIEDKITEVDKTVWFSVSITDSTFVNPIYSLENEPTAATIDSNGQFVWTPTASHGNIEDVSYSFDIIVNADNQEDSENITIIVKKAYEQPLVEPVPEPVVQQVVNCGPGTESVNGVCQVIKAEKPEESEEGGGCLIATAAYGSELSPQVQMLREIRDNQLMNTESGSAFMKTFNEAYYSFSPYIADLERESPVFKEIVKVGLTPMISTLSIMESAETESEVLGVGLSVIALNLAMYIGLPIIGVIAIVKRK